jgi:hypothetical protein
LPLFAEEAEFLKTEKQASLTVNDAGKTEQA